jgi:hypothetical protein
MVFDAATHNRVGNSHLRRVVRPWVSFATSHRIGSTGKKAEHIGDLG